LDLHSGVAIRRDNWAGRRWKRTIPPYIISMDQGKEYPAKKVPGESGTRPDGAQDGSKMAGKSILIAEARPKIEVPAKPDRDGARF
jgi:hypothetical protein